MLGDCGCLTFRFKASSFCNAGVLATSAGVWLSWKAGKKQKKAAKEREKQETR